AGYVFLYLNVLLNTFGNLFKVHFQLHPQVAATGTPATALATTTAATKEIAKAAATTTTAEYIAEVAKNVFHVHTSAAAKAACTTTAWSKCCMAIPVVLGSFIGIAKHFVSLGRFLKL